MRNQIKARLYKELGFLVAFLLLTTTASAEMNKWKYKIITEKKMIIKCTQTIDDECITWNWVKRSEQCTTKMIIGENPIEIRIPDNGELPPPVCIPTWCDLPLQDCSLSPLTGGTDSCGDPCTKPSILWPNCIEP